MAINASVQHNGGFSPRYYQPGKVANPARGQLNREMNISLSAFTPESLVS